MVSSTPSPPCTTGGEKIATHTNRESRYRITAFWRWGQPHSQGASADICHENALAAGYFKLRIPHTPTRCSTSPHHSCPPRRRPMPCRPCTTPYWVLPHFTTPCDTPHHSGVPRHTIPHGTVLPHDSVPYDTPYTSHDTPHLATPYRIVPYHTAPYRTVPYRTPRHLSIPCDDISHHTMSYRTVPYQIVPCQSVQHRGMLRQGRTRNPLALPCIDEASNKRPP